MPSRMLPQMTVAVPMSLALASLPACFTPAMESLSCVLLLPAPHSNQEGHPAKFGLNGEKDPRSAVRPPPCPHTPCWLLLGACTLS